MQIPAQEVRAGLWEEVVGLLVFFLQESGAALKGMLREATKAGVL